MPPTSLKAQASGPRTLAIAWVRGVLGCNDFSAGATKHAWRPSPSPWPPSSPLGERKGDGSPQLSSHPCLLRHGERKGERGVRERTNVGNPLRNGRTDSVHAR